MGSEVFLRVLGPVRLERDGVDLDLGGTRQREVLVRLAVAQGRTVTTETLLADLWGAGPSDAASLHVSISKLRRAIDPERRARARSSLVSTTGGYALSVNSDATVAEEHGRRAAELLGSGEVAEARAAVTEARSMWRGEPYEQIGEHSWLVPDRRRCTDLGVYLVALHAETTLRLGDDPGAVVLDLAGTVQQYPTHERLAVLLAVALYREQRQDDALRVLRSTREHLREHAGLDPGADLQRVEQLILTGQSDPYAAHRPAPVTPGPAPARTLIGRGRPRAVIAAAAEAAAAGRPTTVLLIGEAGIGKTRLARTVADELMSHGWRSVWANGTEDGGAPALWPWLSIVRQLGPAVPLGPDLEALVEGGDTPRAGAEPAAERWRQTQSIARFLQDAAAASPLLIVLDDLHWTDPASQTLLAELAARTVGCRLLMLVTSRPAETAALTAAFARLSRLGAIRLALDGLTDADVQALAAGAGLEVDARALRERTGGNPFLLHETITFAAETGASPLEVVPASVADVIGARMARLTAGGANIVMVASVLGPIVDAAAVAALAGLDDEQVDDGLDAALAAGLLRADAGNAIRFSHDLVRETAYARLGAARRSRLHARALALLATANGRNPAVLAAHARDAGPAHAEDAVRWSMAAAAESATRHASDTALRWWRVADEADRKAPIADPARHLTVLLGLVRAQLDAGDAVGAIGTRAQAVEVATQVGDQALIRQALTSLDRPQVWLPRPMGRVDASMVRHLEGALTADPPPSPAERSLLLATLAIELYAPANEARCDELTAESVRLAEDVGDAGRLGFAVSARVAATAFPGREAERAEAADRMVEIGRTAGLPGIELAGHQFACRLRLQLFEVRVADEHARQAHRIADDFQLALPRLQQRLWDCSRQALDGDVPGALRMVDEIEQADWPWWGREAMLATVRVTLLLRAGSFTETEPFLGLAATVHPRIAADARTLASGHVIAGDDPGPHDWAWLAAGCIHAQAVLAAGDESAIRATYAFLRPGSGMIAATGSFDAGPVDGYLADLAAALGRAGDERGHRRQLERLRDREGLSG